MKTEDLYRQRILMMKNLQEGLERQIEKSKRSQNCHSSDDIDSLTFSKRGIPLVKLTFCEEEQVWHFNCPICGTCYKTSPEEVSRRVKQKLNLCFCTICDTPLEVILRK